VIYEGTGYKPDGPMHYGMDFGLVDAPSVEDAQMWFDEKLMKYLAEHPWLCDDPPAYIWVKAKHVIRIQSS
jgi:hypothetical protein